MPTDPFKKAYQADMPIDLSLMSHIINDAHLMGTYSLEGNFFARTATYLKRYIDQFPEENRSDALKQLQTRMQELVNNELRTKNISTMTELTTIAEEFANTILNAATESSVSLPGGWTDSMNGHAMVYFFKHGDQGLDFYIYNAGNGIQYHARHSTSTHEVYSPVLIYHVENPIDNTKLTDFIAHLLLARNPKLQGGNAPDFDAKRLYEEIFSQIYGLNQQKKTSIRSITQQPAHLRTSGQLSGTCAQTVLHQLLKESFPDELIYKQFIYQFKRYALDDYLAQQTSNEMHDPGVQNLIKHALKTLGRILLTEGLFDQTFIQQERDALKQCWQKLAQTPPIEQQTQQCPIKYGSPVETTIQITLPSINNRTYSDQMTDERVLHRKPDSINETDDLLQQLRRLRDQCGQLMSNNQPSDVIEILEHVFASFPLPTPDQPFDTPLDFYKEITEENVGTFFTLIDQLQIQYSSACEELGSKRTLPRQLVTGLSVMSILDYVQNRVSPWDTWSAKMLGVTLHTMLAKRLSAFFKQNKSNPWIATNDPVLDSRFQTIKTLYYSQSGSLISSISSLLNLLAELSITILNLFAELSITISVFIILLGMSVGLAILLESLIVYPIILVPLLLLLIPLFIFCIPFLIKTIFFDLYPENMFKKTDVDFNAFEIEYYSNIINSEPELKQKLEELYVMPDTPEGKEIDRVLRFHGCKALYVLSCNRFRLDEDNTFEPLIRKIKNQECLERGLFSIWLKNDLKTPIQLIKLDFSRSRDNGMWCYIDSHAANYAKTIFSFSLDTAFIKQKYIIKTPYLMALQSDKSDNSIQLISGVELGSNPIGQRQLFHLRKAPSLQIRETLDYFKSHLDKLADRDYQIYMEANVFQQNLLINELDDKKGDILQLMDDFVDAGIQYNTEHAQCTQSSLFFVRMAYLVYDYAARHQPPQAAIMLEKLQQRLTSLLNINQDNTPAIKHTLHQYQFLTAFRRLKLNPDMNEDLIALAMISFFCMNASHNPHIKLDKATLFDLECAKRDFGHVVQRCSPVYFELIKPVIINHLNIQWTQGYTIDMMCGLVFNDKGWSLISTPLHISECILKNYPDADVPTSCFVSQSREYELGTPEPVLRSTSYGDIKKIWTVNGQTRWYTLSCAYTRHDIHILPLSLRQRGMHYWLQNDEMLITDNKRPICRYDQTTQKIKQLDDNGQDNGYCLCVEKTWLDSLFSAFESPDFVTVWKQDNNFKIELSRYGLTLLAKQETRNLFSSKWVFRLHDLPTYTLITDPKTQTCSRLPGLPSVATLIFKDETTQQCHCYIPVQAFVATSARSPHSEFYHFTHDTTGVVIASLVKGKTTPWRIANTEQFIAFQLDKNRHPKPENAHDALYMCYVYLGNHRPELAWSILNDAAKRQGGLKGTVEEISLLQMIVQVLPHTDAETRDAKVETPPYVACKLKAMAMLTRVLTPDKTIAFPKTNVDTNTPDGYYTHKKLENTQTFYNEFNTTLYTLYSRYQTMHQDITHGFNLSDEERQQLLDYYHVNLPGQEPKAMGALGYERQQLRLKMLIREKAALDAKQENDRLPLAYKRRQQEITAVLKLEKTVRGHHSDLELHTLDLSLSQKPALNVTHLEYDLFYVPTTENINRAIAELKPDITPDEFSNNFPVYFRLLITVSDLEQRKKLVDFCYLHLIVHHHDPVNQQTPITYLCNIIYRIDYSFGLFSTNLSFLTPMINTVSSYLPSYNIPFTRLFHIAEALPDPVIKIYELCDTLSETLPLNSTAWAQETPGPGPVMVAKESIRLTHFTFEKLLEQCELTPIIQRDIQQHAQDYRQAAKLFGAAPNESARRSDSCMDFTAERQAGIAQGESLKAMKRIACDLLHEKTCRAALKDKAVEFIKELEELATNRITLALQWANKGFQATPEDALRKELALDSEIRAPLTQEKLLALYFNADKTQYRLKTGLTDSQIDQLHFYLGAFIALSVRQQTLQRFVDKISTLNDHSTASTMQLAAHELLTEDSIDYKTEPVMALFQYYENMLLRPQQKAALNRMVTTPDGFSYAEVIEKIIMGGGKSKVILPLLANRKANGVNLVVIEAPRGLFETYCADLSNLSGQLFDQKVFAFDFDRDPIHCTIENLDYLHSRLIDTIVRKNYVITTGDAMQSLELKYLELLLQPPADKARQAIWEKQVAGLDKLVNLFRNRADAVIDEVHQALLLKKKLNYTLGEGGSISPEVIQNTVALYEFFDNVPSRVLDNVSLADLLTNNQLITNEDQWQTVFQQLAQMLVMHPDSPLKPVLDQMEPPLTEHDKNQLCLYLLDKQAADCVCRASIKIRNILAHGKEQVSRLLPMTLRRNLNEHYGASHLHPDTTIAIPYSANNEPSERSRFGNYLESMNFTIQMVMKEGLSSDLLHCYLRQLQEQACLELIKQPQLIQIDNTPTGSSFHKLVPTYQLSQINLKDEHAFALVFNHLRYNKRLICKVLETDILPKQTVDAEILYSNAHGHVDIYHTTQGLTGTPDFHSTWHSRLQFDQHNVPATNGFIIHLLEKKKTPVQSVDYTRSDLLHHLLNGRENVHAIIDVCAALKGTPNKKVAQDLARYLRETQSSLRYVLFFNQDNMLCALSIREDSKTVILNTSDPGKINRALNCTPEQRFTYYDQVHTLGTDLKQAASAKALTLIDHNTQLSGFLQGAMRMRGLADEQCIELIVPKALEQHNLNDLLIMMDHNQQQQLMRDNFIAVKSRMNNHVRAHIMQRILAYSTIEEKQQLLMKFKACFVTHPTDESNFYKSHGQISSLRETKQLLEEYREKLLAIDVSLALLRPILDKEIEDALPLCQHDYASLSNSEEGTEIELQNQVELQQEQEQEQEQELILQDKTRYPVPYIPWLISPGHHVYTRATGFLSLTALCQGHTAPAPEFGEIYVNLNYYQTYITQRQYISDYLKPVHALLFRKSASGNLDCVILSQQEAEDLAVRMKSTPEPDVWISNTAMTPLAGQPSAGITQDPRYQELIEQVRFFSGDFRLLLKGDIPLNWLSKNTDQKLAFFKHALRPCRETDSQDLINLYQVLADQQTAFNYMIQNPSIDYTVTGWWTNVSIALSNEALMQTHYANLLKVHSLKNITELMSKQSPETFSTFLDSNHFKADADIVRTVLDTANKQTFNHVVAVLSAMNDVSAEVRQVIHEKTTHYNFYFKCLASIGIVTGGACIVVGILALNPIIAAIGVVTLVVSATALMSQTGFFTKPESGAADGSQPILLPKQLL